MQSTVIYAVELGGVHCTAGVYVDGITVQLAERRTPQSREESSDALLDTVRSLIEEVQQTAPPMNALAVSFSGFLDLREKLNARDYGPLRNNEVMVSAHHINGIRNLPFFEWMESAGWNVPLHIENDVNAALRSVSEFPTAICINMGSGVAAAIKRDHQISHAPSTWSCYQIAHGFRWSPPEELTRKCGCGSIGCLEAVIGAWALAERYGVRPEEAPPEIYEKMLDDVLTHLSPAVAQLVDKSGIETVLFSGRAARGFHEVTDFAQAMADRIQAERAQQEPIKVRVIDQAARAGLHGVALAALDYRIVSSRAVN